MEFRLLTVKHLATYQFAITSLWWSIWKAKIRIKLRIYVTSNVMESTESYTIQPIHFIGCNWICIYRIKFYLLFTPGITVIRTQVKNRWYWLLFEIDEIYTRNKPTRTKNWIKPLNSIWLITMADRWTGLFQCAYKLKAMV